MINRRAIRCQDCGASDPEVVLRSDEFDLLVAFCERCALGRVLITVHLEHDLPIPQG